MKKVGITPGPVKFDNMEPNDVKQFTPSNTGTEGQILTKTSDGYNWQTQDVDEFTPSNTGTTGQVLTKTSDGYNWQTPSGGSDVGIVFHTVGTDFSEGEIEHGDILVDTPQTITAMLTYTIRAKEGSSNIGVYSDLKASVVLNKEIIDNRYHGSCAFTAYQGAEPSVIPILINANIYATISTGETTRFNMTFRYAGVFKKTFSYLSIDNVELTVTGIDFCVNQ